MSLTAWPAQSQILCLCLVDIEEQKNKKDFHRKLIIAFSPPPSILAQRRTMFNRDKGTDHRIALTKL